MAEIVLETTLGLLVVITQAESCGVCMFDSDLTECRKQPDQLNNFHQTN
ncbi:LOW QUALITY PROTEIN: hypothetical protein PanWU01x14_343250 [Parasponia andersonii]|uniref:Uncharacterized protein n=1 Tax=Parasponia andersonii TaxID=3476 RepID=A0A2P5ADL8_PARAD|nr:LOW QUALITY PROTEIN: hypothetical protein PanWU01x14_343250 [Parasponia andersonii]